MSHITSSDWPYTIIGLGVLDNLNITWCIDIEWNQIQNSVYLRNNGLGKAIGAFGLSYLVGAKFHSNRISKKMKSKHLKDQKALYTQYYNDVYKLEQQKAEQQAVIEQLQAALQ